MRKPTIARDEAATICRSRLLEAQSGQPLSDLDAFQKGLVDAGVIRRPMSRVTLWKILTGRYYTALECPFSGESIDFSEIARLGWVARRNGNVERRASSKSRLEQLELEMRALRRRVEELGTRSVSFEAPRPPQAPQVAKAFVPPEGWNA